MSELPGSLGSPAPGHDGRVEDAVGAPDTRHLHDQRQSKELVIALTVGLVIALTVALVCVLHLTNTGRKEREDGEEGEGRKRGGRREASQYRQ